MALPPLKSAELIASRSEDVSINPEGVKKTAEKVGGQGIGVRAYLSSRETVCTRLFSSSVADVDSVSLLNAC